MSKIERLAANIKEAKKQRLLSVDATNTILSSSLSGVFNITNSTWKIFRLAEVAEIVDPNPSHRMPLYSDVGIPFISTVDFYGSEDIRINTAKFVENQTYLEQKDRCRFSVGDILFSRIGTIGQTRILEKVWPFALSHVLVVVKPSSKVIPRFLLWYLRSDAIAAQATKGTRSIGVPDLGIKRIRSFRIPLPDKIVQAEIVAYYDAMQTKIDKLQDFQSKTTAELDALLPSVLDKAFKGEL